ncbi:MAG: hypothetical protein JWN74_1345 [Acidobacteriaceae bacterium]|nr:hypothetical protein [Acidobacteriaceae bacterium]
MAASKYRLLRTIALWRLEKISFPELPAFAWDALELGFDGQSIRRLAALDKPSYFQIGNLFEQVVEETGIAQMSKTDAALFLAKEIAKEILSGQKDPLQGAYEIFLLGYPADFPDAIVVFGALDQEFDIPQIMDKCRALTLEPIDSGTAVPSS